MNEIDYTKYSLDRDIPQNEWSKYLSSYSNSYRTERDSEGNTVIKCSKGKIGVYSILQKKLLFSSFEMSKKSKTFFLMKIRKEADKNVEVTQDCDHEFNLKFDEDKLPLVESALGILKKMNLSDEERSRRSTQMKENLKCKPN